MTRVSTRIPAQADWLDLLDRAKTYMSASAWMSAEQILLGPVQRLWNAPSWTSDEILAVSLLAYCWKRQDKQEPVHQAVSRLERMLPECDAVSPEASLYAAICIASHQNVRGSPNTALKILDGTSQLPVAQLPQWARGRRELLYAACAMHMDNLDGAEDRSLAAIRYARASKSESLLGDCYLMLAATARRRGRLNDSLALYGAASGAYGRTAERGCLALVALNSGITSSLRGDFSTASERFLEAQDLATELNRPITTLRARLGEGYARMKEGDLHIARTILLGAWRKARAVNVPRDEAIALDYLMQYYLMCGQLSKAERAMRLAERISCKVKDFANVVVTMKLGQALVRCVQGEKRTPVALCREAHSLAREKTLLWEQGMSLGVLGIVSVRSGLRRQAATAFKDAKTIYGQIGEVFESKIIDAWLVGLNAKSPKAAVEDLRAFAAKIDRGRESLLFLLNHDVWGPEAWFKALVSRRRDRRPAGKGDVAKRTGRSVVSSGSLRSEHDMVSGAWHELGLVTRSPRVHELLNTAETFAPGTLPVLILGETGTGKDLVAKGIHRLSGRRGEYVPVNCAAASRELFAAELFGARRGAYTGATENREGLIRRATQGTVFLDEIADLDLEAQGYLLRFLDSGEVRAVGATESVIVDARILAATCRDLIEMTRERTFRADLLNRLSGLRLHMPALRERMEDLELLIESLWVRENGTIGVWPAIFTSRVIGMMCRRPWGGNVRELKHLVTRAVQVAKVMGEAAARRDIGRQLSS